MSEIIDIVEPYIPGPQGESGEITSATAVGLAAGADPTVTLGGTPEQRTIQFGIPKGDPGSDGDDATITGVTASTLPPQSDATVTMGGTPTARTFAFGIPKGDPGSGSVNSVNGDLGPDVVLDAADVGAITPAGVDSKIEDALADLPRGADLVGSIRYPLYIAHRGSMLCYPENSWEAYRASYEAGFTPEADVRALADGTLVCLHDATTTRTMNITGNVASQTVAQWRAAKIKPPVNPGTIGGLPAMTGTGWGTPVFFEDYLDEFGGKIALWPEIKVTGAPATAAIKAVTDRGLHRSVIIQSGTLAVCEEAVAAGVPALMLTNTTAPATLVAAGIEYVGVSAAATNAYVTSCKTAGLKVIAYAMNTKAEADAQLARGCDGVFSDDPWEVSRQFTPVTSLDLSSGHLPPAMQWMRGHSAAPATGTTQRLEVANDTFLFLNEETTAYGGRVRLGMFGFNVGNSMTVRLTAQSIGTVTNEGNWMFGVYLGKQIGDVAVNEEPLESQFRFAMVRRDGRKHAYEKRTMTDPISQLGTGVPATTPPYAKVGGRSAPMDFEIQFTPTTVSIRNLTLNDTDLEATNTSLSIPGSYVTLCLNGSVGRVYDVSVKFP